MKSALLGSGEEPRRLPPSPAAPLAVMKLTTPQLFRSPSTSSLLVSEHRRIRGREPRGQKCPEGGLPGGGLDFAHSEIPFRAAASGEETRITNLMGAMIRPQRPETTSTWVVGHGMV